jgi:hypothetical protein
LASSPTSHLLRPTSHIAGSLVLLAATLLAVAGCEATIDAGEGPDRPFSLYGFFNAASEQQAVRVVPVYETLQPETRDPIDAVVTSTDLGTGEVVVWRDSVVEFVGGAVGHVYVADFRAAYETTYRFTATRSDGEVSEATTRMPPQATIVVGEAPFETREVDDDGDPNTPPRIDTVYTPDIPAEVRGSIPRLLDLVVEYRVRVDGGAAEGSIVRIDYDEQGDVTPTASGWLVAVQMGRDRAEVSRSLLRTGQVTSFSDPVTLLDVTATMLAVSEDWVSPVGTFDPEVLVEPGTFTNVANGFGFVGAGYPIAFALESVQGVVEAAGFVYAP